MQFVLLLLFNVFLGAVLYLVISLKLEKSASEYRERKMRKEMDEVIKEFNMTAERNISILESRIRMMRRILERTGDIKWLDCSVDDGPTDGATAAALDAAARDGREAPARERESAITAPNSGDNTAPFPKKGLLLLFERCSAIFSWNRGRPIPGREAAYGAEPSAEMTVRAAFTARDDGETSIIRREVDTDAAPEMPGAGNAGCPPTEEELRALVEAAEDRYSLVALLHERGCPVEEISRYSGVPAGEVRLVLNLNSSR